jgi:DNA-binding response OmpR family regulator
MGVKLAQEHLPDLIICDVMMPVLNGYEVLSALRQNPMTATIPFIFLTAMADKAELRHGMEVGADDYLTKLFTADELLAASATRFAKHEAAMQQYNSEQKRSKKLQQKVQQLQQYTDSKDALLKQLQQKVHNIVPKLNIAIHLLKSLQSEGQREECLKILQAVCTDEIVLLNQMPNLQNILTAEDVNILSQFGIVKLTDS